MDCYLNAVSGGGTSGGGGTEFVDAIPENPDTGVLYQYNDSVRGQILLLYNGDKLLYVPMAVYENNIIITPEDIFTNCSGKKYSSSDVVSLEVLSESIIIDGFLANSAVKIYGNGQMNDHGWIFYFTPMQGATVTEAYIYIGVSAEGGDCDYGKVQINDGDVIYCKPPLNTFNTFKVPIVIQEGQNKVDVRLYKDRYTSSLDDSVYIYGLEYKME